MTKKTKIACPLESEEGVALMSWAAYHPIAKYYLFHISNENKTSWQNGRSLKAQGKKKGVSDYLLAYPSNEKHGLFIELKRRVRSLSKLSEDQAIFLAQQTRVGYAAFVAYGSDEAIDIIKKYFGE